MTTKHEVGCLNSGPAEHCDYCATERCDYCGFPLNGEPCYCHPPVDEPEIDDTVHECPNCERAQQFSGLCATCMDEMRLTPEDPLWQRIHAS